MTIQALLIDLDGTVYEKGNLLPGIVECINWLKIKHIPFKFCTNTTRKTIQDIQNNLHKMGLEINQENIISPIKAAINYCKQQQYASIQVIVPDVKILHSFDQFKITQNTPEAIILGDMGDEFTHPLLTDIFMKMLNGAELIALHKNRYWLTKKGLMLDLGPFVSGLEYATEKNAVVVGKPNLQFFEMAIQDWNISKNNIVMVGDDLVVDVQGAQSSGLKGCLVKTGKFRDEDLNNMDIQPEFVLSSLADLKNLFQNN